MCFDGHCFVILSHQPMCTFYTVFDRSLPPRGMTTLLLHLRSDHSDDRRVDTVRLQPVSIVIMIHYPLPALTPVALFSLIYIRSVCILKSNNFLVQGSAVSSIVKCKGTSGLSNGLSDPIRRDHS